MNDMLSTVIVRDQVIILLMYTCLNMIGRYTNQVVDKEANKSGVTLA